MGVWAGPDWPQAGLEQSRRLPLPGARTAGGASRIPEQPRPGDALAPGTLARAGYHGGSPLHAREQRPFGTMGLPPPPPSGEIQRQRSAARHGARRRESKGGGGRGHGRGWRRAREPAGRAPGVRALPSAPQRRQRRERGPAAFQPAAERVCTQRGAGPPTSARAQTAGRAPAADGQRRRPSPRPSGAGDRGSRGAPPLPDSPTAPCPSSWRNSKRLGPSSCPAVRPSALPSVCPTSHWLAGGLAALLLCLRRCRHLRTPQ